MSMHRTGPGRMGVGQAQSFYERLCAAGKPKKLALAAVAHKLLIILNAMMRRRARWAHA